MDMPDDRRAHRGEAFARSLLGFALIVAVAWAMFGNADSGSGLTLAGFAQR